MARECCAVLAEEILKQFVADITDEWLDARYGPLCWPRTETAMTCRRCAGSGRRVWYPPCRAAFIGVAREECDGCGTVCEQLGDCPPRRPIRATVAAGRLTVTLPALDPSASGYVFVRKNPGAAPLPWPSGGGKVAFDLHALARRGRVTAAAVAVGDQWLEVDYHTIFVPL